MRYYESLYIVNPNYEQSKIDQAMKTVSDKVSEYGFNVINHFVWGKKRLAYNIQEHKYGSYVLMHFETNSVENLERFERFMVLEKSIVRNQTVLLDEKPEKKSEKERPAEEEKTNRSKDDSKESVRSTNKHKPTEEPTDSEEESTDSEEESTEDKPTEEPTDSEEESTEDKPTEEPTDSEEDKEEK